MSKIDDLLKRWNDEKKSHKTWAIWLRDSIIASLKDEITPLSPNDFIKIPVQYRLKDDDGLVEKAFFRDKEYHDPYSEITDKVGIRFVVLLGSDIEKISNAVKKLNNCIWEKARDYEIEQKDNPLKFDYAAVHYVITPRTEFEFSGVKIPCNVHCEVQIKTLLQHAYSELTHDKIYKAQVDVTPHMRRDTAKAMALLEATNDYFEKVSEDVNKLLCNVRQMTAELSHLYKKLIGTNPKPTTLEGVFLDSYGKDLPVNYIDEIEKFFKKKSYLIDNIKQHLIDKNLIFKQPSILIIYWKTDLYGFYIEKWPLTLNEIEPLLNDLGLSTDNLY